MIHDLNDISAIVMPLDFFTNARRLSTCPRKVTNTVTKDSSMLLAMAAAIKDAVAGVNLPLLTIPCPKRGLAIAVPSHRPERAVE